MNLASLILLILLFLSISILVYYLSDKVENDENKQRKLNNKYLNDVGINTKEPYYYVTPYFVTEEKNVLIKQYSNPVCIVAPLDGTIKLDTCNTRDRSMIWSFPSKVEGDYHISNIRNEQSLACLNVTKMNNYDNGAFVTQGACGTPESDWVIISTRSVTKPDLPLEIYYINRESNQCLINTSFGLQTTPDACKKPFRQVTWGAYNALV